MKKWARWTVGIVLGFALVITALWQEENRRGRRMWEETCARLRAAGEPVELADIIPPMIPDEDNVAAAPIFAEVFVDKEAARLTQYVDAFSGMGVGPAGGGAMRPSAKPLFHDDMSALDEWRDFLRACCPAKAPTTPVAAADEIQHYFSGWERELREIRDALQRPRCRWPLRYQDGVRMNNPVLALPMGLCSNARPMVLASAAKGDAAACVETLIIHLHLVQAMSEGSPYLIGYLVALTGDAMMLQTLQHVLGVVQFDEAQLATLQHVISRISLHDTYRAFQCERVVASHWMTHMTLEDLRQWFEFQNGTTTSSMLDKVKMAGRNIKVFAMAKRPEGWKLADGADYAAFLYDEVQSCVDESAGTVLHSRATAMDAAFAARKAAAGRLSFMKVSSSFGSLLGKEAQHQAMTREALLWCAIERFRLKLGSPPENLDALVPEFLDKIPCDPVNGLPLRYVRKGDRDYLLYSIGWNDKDDGGVETKRRDKGDWVWASDPRLIINKDVEREKAAQEREAQWRADRAKRAAESNAKKEAKTK
jgi:hypothetical protein